MAQTGQDARHPASRRRLQQARRDGRVARSAELTGLAVMAVGVACVVWLTPNAARELAAMARELWRVDAMPTAAGDAVATAMTRGCMALTQVVGPMLMLLLGAAIVGRSIFGGFVWSTQPMQPQVARVLPGAAGIERLLGAAAMLRMGVQCIKAALLFGVALWLAWTLAPALSSLMSGAVSDLPQAMLGLLTPAGGALLACLAVVAMLDVALQRWLHLRSLRMTDQECRDEAKQSGVDPRIRHRQRTAAKSNSDATPSPALTATAGLMTDAVALVVASAGDNTLPTLAVLVRQAQGGRLAVAVVATQMDRVRALASAAREANVRVIPHGGLAMALAHRAGGRAGEALPPSLADALRRLLAAAPSSSSSPSATATASALPALRQATTTGSDLEVPRI